MRFELDNVIEPKSLTEAAYSKLRASILACRLKPGMRLKLSEIVVDVEANLSAVREALSRLCSEGLVVSEPQKGFQVAPVSLADLRDLTETRVEIETLCLLRAMTRGGLEWEARIFQAYYRLSRTPERAPEDEDRLSDQWVAAHAELHEALASACESDWLLKIRSMLYDQSERYRRLSVLHSREERNLDDEHKAIVEAVLARDHQGATALLRQHISKTRDLVVG